MYCRHRKALGRFEIDMVAMILAAGRGERMRPLSDTTPKPLLQIANKPLLVWHIENLATVGFKTIVINVAHLGEQIIFALGDGSKWGVEILYSDERHEGALESAGGIVKALDLIGSDIFLVINGDIWCDYRFDATFTMDSLAHLVLVPNPPHNTKGDFSYHDGKVALAGGLNYTFSGIGYYSKRLFEDLEYGKLGLGVLLRTVLNQGKSISGEIYRGRWYDIGTPQRLETANKLANRL